MRNPFFSIDFHGGRRKTEHTKKEGREDHGRKQIDRTDGSEDGRREEEKEGKGEGEKGDGC